MDDMEPFCKLAHPENYTTTGWDLVADVPARAAWLRTFDEHTDSLLKHSRGSLHPPAEAALVEYAAAFRGLLARIALAPRDFAPLDIYKLCKLRADLMKAHAGARCPAAGRRCRNAHPRHSGRQQVRPWRERHHRIVRGCRH
jgi:hypothetical protein